MQRRVRQGAGASNGVTRRAGGGRTIESRTMGAVEKLLAGFKSGTLLRPSVDVPNSVDLSRAVARLCGDASNWGNPGDDGDSAGAGSVDEIAGLIGPSEHLVFVMADGLGMTLLESLNESAFLRRHLAQELRSVFPSTTAAALTTLATGAWPGKHAVTGWWTHIAEISGPATVLPFVSRATGAPLAEHGVTAETAFPITSRLSSFDRSVMGILPDNLVRSIFSGYSLGRAIRRGYGSISDGVDRVLTRLQNASGPSYTYLYLPQIDSAEHTTGVHSGATRAALDDVNSGLERLAAAMPETATLVVTSDHGHLDAFPAEPMLIREDDEIGRMLRFAPSGDARVNYYHVRSDLLGRFADAFAGRMPEQVALLTPDELEELELLGPGELPALTRARIGDYIAISTDAAVFAWAYTGADGPDMTRLVSHHSGLSPDEMRIPLIVSGAG